MLTQIRTLPEPGLNDNKMPNANTPDDTDDEWLTNGLYPLKTNEWFDGQEQTC